MLTDHNRMAAYHAAIVGNADIFKDKIVMDVGTGSGILAGECLLCEQCMRCLFLLFDVLFYMFILISFYTIISTTPHQSTKQYGQHKPEPNESTQ